MEEEEVDLFNKYAKQKEALRITEDKLCKVVNYYVDTNCALANKY